MGSKTSDAEASFLYRSGGAMKLKGGIRMMKMSNLIISVSEYQLKIMNSLADDLLNGGLLMGKTIVMDAT
jgi:hypothetical protein